MGMLTFYQLLNFTFHSTLIITIQYIRYYQNKAHTLSSTFIFYCIQITRLTLVNKSDIELYQSFNHRTVENTHKLDK